MNSQRRLRFQSRLLLLVLVAAAPAWLAATTLLWNWEANPALRWALFVLISIFAVGGAFTVRRNVVSPLQSLANLLEALREDDYSQRGRIADPGDALGEVMVELNSLSGMLHEQRLKALEAGVLLEKVISEVDIAVFAFDTERRLRLINRAGEALLGRSGEDLQDQSAEDLGLSLMLDWVPGTVLIGSSLTPVRSIWTLSTSCLAPPLPALPRSLVVTVRVSAAVPTTSVFPV